jgi:hypothetical protein
MSNEPSKLTKNQKIVKDWQQDTVMTNIAFLDKRLTDIDERIFIKYLRVLKREKKDPEFIYCALENCSNDLVNSSNKVIKTIQEISNSTYTLADTKLNNRLGAIKLLSRNIDIFRDRIEEQIVNIEENLPKLYLHELMHIRVKIFSKILRNHSKDFSTDCKKIIS